jgi:hypothetical protein
MTSPTPIDGLVWSYHQLGWSTRRIAGEVNTSQATVVRILDRLKKDPPQPETLIMNSTPPSGLPELSPVPAYYDDEQQPPREPWLYRRGMLIMTILMILLIGALAATLAAASGGLIARGRTGPAGPPGVPGPAAPPQPHRVFQLCVRYSAFSGAVISLTAPEKGSCGTATLIRIPG